MRDHPARVAPLAGILSREDWPVLAALPAVASLFVFAVPALGWWAFAAAGLVYAAGFIGFERVRAARAARRQIVSTLGRITDRAVVVPAGHAQRTRRLAGDLGRGLGLGSAAVATIEDAAQIRSVGLLAVEGREEIDPQIRHRIAARRSLAIVAQAGESARLAPFLAVEPPVGAAVAQWRAVVDLAAVYDEAVTVHGCDPDVAVAHLAESGRADVVDALRSVVRAQAG